MLFDLLYNFFLQHVFNYGESGLSDTYLDIQFNIGNGVVTTQSWLCFVCALISSIIIVTLCCLFVYKIIKLIGGLIR